MCISKWTVSIRNSQVLIGVDISVLYVRNGFTNSGRTLEMRVLVSLGKSGMLKEIILLQ